MARVLPWSLSPHVCIISSDDLNDVLVSSSLPPLHQVLQSFSPLSQVTTRTSALTSVPHPSFALRFSDLTDIEEACKEDEEQRALRTIDWIGARVSRRSAKWAEEMEKARSLDMTHTPWWEEVKRCVDSDHVPSRHEGWNHPISIIYAVSTTTPNPLQAISALHARGTDLPPWVDTTRLPYIVIIHPHNSSLSDEEAGALFNAVKKQYGLHSYLLPLELPKPLPAPVPVPTIHPRLPPPLRDSDLIPPSTPQSALLSPVMSPSAPKSPTLAPPPSSALHLSQQDIQQIARFVREFVTMSLVPWMEKYVMEWNEAYSSSRRITSRVFSSTRRLFGSSSPATSSVPLPGSPASSRHGHTSSMSSSMHMSTDGGYGALSQQRRLAEFATILGDYKLAMTIWETLRKESKGGSDMLPLLSSPSPAIPLYVSNALLALHPSANETPPSAQLRALVYVNRWETGISSDDFLGNVLEGDRWMVWAAGAAEEAPMAILLGHAALLSVQRGAYRRAALWYLLAANHLEKCGIKPLTMYFLRRAHELYKSPPEKSLSPSFWEAEGKSPKDFAGFDAVASGIEQPLGRLLYTTGDVSGAVSLFLGLLRGIERPVVFPEVLSSPNADPKNTDNTLLEDFRVAFKHLLKIDDKHGKETDLKLPFKFCDARASKIRIPRASSDDDLSEWERRTEEWQTFWKTRGNERLETDQKAVVNETFWIDLVLRNPLDADVTLSDLSVNISAESEDPLSYTEIESLDEIRLGPKEQRTIPIALRCSRPASFTVSEATFKFLSLLPCSESLASRGKRLHATPQQRQNVVYGPDVAIKVNVVETTHRLLGAFVDDTRLVAMEGEYRSLDIWMSNQGNKPIDEAWIVTGPLDDVFIEGESNDSEGSLSTENGIVTLNSSNSLAIQPPRLIRLGKSEQSLSLEPEESITIKMRMHCRNTGQGVLRLLLVYLDRDSGSFRPVQISRYYAVSPALRISATSRPSYAVDHPFMLHLNVENATSSTPINIGDIMVVSPTWRCSPLDKHTMDTLGPRQSERISFGLNLTLPTANQDSLDFVSAKLRAVLTGEKIEATYPPQVKLIATSAVKEPSRTLNDASVRSFLHSDRRAVVAQSVIDAHPHIPSTSHAHIFPLYNPLTVDVLVFWRSPGDGRSGHVLRTGLIVGPSHAALQEIIESVENAKVKRSIYAETQREKMEILEAVRQSEWNMEMNPVVVTVEGGVQITHDFSKGPRQVTAAFTLRNLSLTHPSRYVLKLSPPPPSQSFSPDLLPPQYIGRTTFRGTLKPMESIALHPKLWVTRPGTYALDCWALETEVGVPSAETDAEPWQTRHRYSNGPSANDHASITVLGIVAM